MKEEVRYVRLKGNPDNKPMVLTPALVERLETGDFEELSEEKVKALLDETAKKMNAVPGKMRFLRNKEFPERVFPWTQALSENPDFEECGPPGYKGKQAAESIEDTVNLVDEDVEIPEPKPVEPDESIVEANKEQLVISAIAALNPETDFTQEPPQKSSRPKCEMLTAAVGFEVSSALRDSAWDAYQGVQEVEIDQ